VKFTEWQWKLQDEMEEAVALANQPRVDEQQLCAIGKGRSHGNVKLSGSK